MTDKKKEIYSQSQEEMIATDKISDNLQFIRESKKLAKTHEWLYHCTNTAALRSILKNREFWLTNLKLVNDKEEVGRIDIPEYENKYYICCFTYDPQISDEHWAEYSSAVDGVLIGVKSEWFLQKATFMLEDNSKCNHELAVIRESYGEAVKARNINEENGKISNPFYINAFGFYQIRYDDELVQDISSVSSMSFNGNETEVQVLIPEMAGIIKSKHGVCSRCGREPYVKAWIAEKEVRLKVGIQQISIFPNGNELHDGMIMKPTFPKIAVPISEEAFDVVKIGFSPKFAEADKEEFLKELRELLPTSTIEVIPQGKS